MAHLVKCPTLDFGSGHDLRVMRLSLHQAWSLFEILSLPLLLASFANERRKERKERKRKKERKKEERKTKRKKERKKEEQVFSAKMLFQVSFNKASMKESYIRV